MSKITLKHLESETGVVVTRKTARNYTHVLLVRYRNPEAEIRSIKESLANVMTFESWTDSMKEEARVRAEKRIEEVLTNGRKFSVLSWHGSAKNARLESRLEKWYEAKVEEINHGVVA